MQLAQRVVALDRKIARYLDSTVRHSIEFRCLHTISNVNDADSLWAVFWYSAAIRVGHTLYHDVLHPLAQKVQSMNARRNKQDGII